MHTPVTGPTAALAGVPAGLQAQGIWAGRRQLFIRFAAEAETATMYTADALANEIKRSAGRSVFHSISISGRDPLANAEYIGVTLDKAPSKLPVMVDSDGQRPEAIPELKRFLALVQVTLEGAGLDAMIERGLETVEAAARAGLEHALVLAPTEHTSDAQLLRIVEQAHSASDKTMLVIHPPVGLPIDRDRRWMTLLERAAALHGDIRLSLRLPPPTGMR